MSRPRGRGDRSPGHDGQASGRGGARDGEPMVPSFPLGPSRPALPRRARRAGGITLAVACLVTVLIGIRLATTPATQGLHVVTIPAADRGASRALLNAAEAVGFEPTSDAGSGTIEGAPLPSPLPPSSVALLAPGLRAPGFTLRTPTGARVALTSLRGRAVLLEFFATWCPHCNAEAPHIERLAHSLPPRRYAFAAIDADGETAPSVLAFHIYYGLGFPALLDPSSRPGSYHTPGGAGAVSSAYRAGTFPTFYVLDPRGRIVWAGSGEQPDALLRAELERAAAAREG